MPLTTSHSKSDSLELPKTESEIQEFNLNIKNGKAVYATVPGMTPVFGDVDFPRHFGQGEEGVILDEWNQIGPTETILLPESIIQIRQVVQGKTSIILELTTNSYPSQTPLYMDADFIKTISTNKPQEREINLPSSDQIIQDMRLQNGKRYIWGGNAPDGIPEMLGKYYKIPDQLELQEKIMFRGHDCSGLLYWATNGYTPRNTSGLIQLGEAVDIENKSVEEIAHTVQPLDIIIWRGHCLIVIDSGEVIESVANWGTEGLHSTPNGVRIRPIRDVLSGLMHSTKPRNPVNIYPGKYDTKEAFAIRRWQ